MYVVPDIKKIDKEPYNVAVAMPLFLTAKPDVDVKLVFPVVSVNIDELM